MRRYALPVWILGVGLSFALPTLPAWWLWGAAFMPAGFGMAMAQIVVATDFIIRFGLWCMAHTASSTTTMGSFRTQTNHCPPYQSDGFTTTR